MGVIGYKHTPEAKAKIGAAQMGRKHTDETKARMSAAQAGERNPNWGRSPSAETRAKLSASKAGEKHPMWGRTHTDEAKAKMSASTTGVLNHNWGRPPSDATKAKISASKARDRNGAWKGDDIGYDAAHDRHQQTLAGQPCAHADDSCAGPLHVAFLHTTPAERVKTFKGRPYSARSEDYLRLCQSHHVRYDNEHRGILE